MDLPFLEELSQEEIRFKKFRIASAGRARVSGDLDKGFAINIEDTLGQGVCCLDGECSITTESDCNDVGGIYRGDDTTCEDVDCTQGACCVGEDCTIETESDCDGMGGTYQGDGTSCDPNPCPTTTGACCFEDGTCTEESEEDCLADGGAFLGSGTDCDPNPCELCSDTVTLCKCGFDDCGGSGKKWLTQTFVETWSIIDESDPDCGGTCSSSGSTTEIREYDPFTCTESITSCSGSLTRFCTNADPQEDDCSWVLSGGDCEAQPSPECDGNFFFLCCSHVIDTSTCEDDGLTDHLNRECDSPGTATGQLDDYTTVSDEYTTEMLIENALSLLTCDEGCSPVYTVSEDESCVTAWCVFDT